MSLPIDEKLFAEGYCVGEYEITVDVGPRVRLPKAVIKVMKQHKVRQVWRFPDPSGPRMILCPAQNRHAYIEVAKQNLPAAMDPGEAHRRFICVGTPAAVADHGKVSITSACNRYLKIIAGQRVVLVGVGPWYELWRQDDWLNDNSKDAGTV